MAKLAIAFHDFANVPKNDCNPQRVRLSHAKQWRWTIAQKDIRFSQTFLSTTASSWWTPACHQTATTADRVYSLSQTFTCVGESAENAWKYCPSPRTSSCSSTSLRLVEAHLLSPVLQTADHTVDVGQHRIPYQGGVGVRSRSWHGIYFVAIPSPSEQIQTQYRISPLKIHCQPADVSFDVMRWVISHVAPPLRLSIQLY